MAKIVLIFPPVAEAHMPNLAIAELAAILRKHGHDVLCLDVNLLAHHELISAVELEKRAGEIHDRFDKLENQKVLKTIHEQREYGRLAGPKAYVDFLVKNIDNSKAAIKNINSYSFDENGHSRIAPHLKIFELSRRLLFSSTVFHPYLYDDDASCFMSWQRILQAIATVENSIYYSLFSSVVIPAVERFTPDIIGINITFAEQIIPAFLLASMIRKRCKESILAIGGNISSLLWREFSSIPEVFSVIDYICKGEGEPALLELTDNLSSKRNESNKIPNMISSHRNRELVYGPKVTWNVNDSPTPDFDYLNPNQYFSGLPQLLYMTSRGCYYGRCRFCNYSVCHEMYKPKRIEKVINDVRLLTHKYKTNLLYLADDAISPRRVWDLAVQINKENIDLKWWCLSRFDKGWKEERLRDIEKSGCYRIFFGGESASDRLQKLADKGFAPLNITKTVALFSKTKIHVHLSAVIGFPTETISEARRTLYMIRKLSKFSGFSFRIHLFRLPVYCRFATEKEIEIVPINCELNSLAVNHPYYKVLGKKAMEVAVQRDRMLKLRDEFEEILQRSPVKFYPESHTYEGLQFFYNLKGEMPRCSPVTDRNITKEKFLYIPSWVVLHKYHFPLKNLLKRNGLIDTWNSEFEILNFFKDLSPDQAFSIIESKIKPIKPEPILWMLNLLDDTDQFIEHGIEKLLIQLNGNRLLSEIISEFLLNNPGHKMRSLMNTFQSLLRRSFLDMK